MLDINEVQTFHAALINRHKLLTKKYEFLEKREAELDADKTMPSEERQKALKALAKEYERIATLMGRLIEEAQLLKDVLCEEDF